MKEGTGVVTLSSVNGRPVIRLQAIAAAVPKSYFSTKPPEIL